MRKRDLRRRLERDYGRVPDTHYFPEDMGNIRAYFDYRRSQGRDAFLLDETTWNDLDLDRLFRRINPRLSTSGEQYLYYLLRSPALDAETWRERKALAALMAGDPKRRLALQMILGGWAAPAGRTWLSPSPRRSTAGACWSSMLPWVPCR